MQAPSPGPRDTGMNAGGGGREGAAESCMSGKALSLREAQTSDHKAFTEKLAIDHSFPRALIGLKAVCGINDYRR
jgi:hypothetical protein